MHGRGDSVRGGEFRKDVCLGKILKGVIKSHLPYPSPLSHLAEYTVGLFIRGRQTEQQSRMLAGLLLRKIEFSILNPQGSPANLPPPLVKICHFIENRLEEKMRLP